MRCCNDFNRSQSCAPRSPRRARPARDRARDADARRHRPDAARSCCSARPAWPCRSTAPTSSARSCSRRASRGAPRAARSRRRRDLPVGRHRRAERAGAGRGHRTTSRCARRTRLDEAARCRSNEDPRLLWHPPAQGLEDLHAAGKVTVVPGDGLRRARTSRTSPRATSTRSARSTSARATGWLGRWLDLRRRRRTTRSRASASRTALPRAGDLARRGRRDHVADGLPLREPRRLGRHVEAAMLEQLRPPRHAADRRPDPAPGAPGAGQRRDPAQPARDAARHRRRSPTRRTTAWRTTCAASRGCSAPACRSAPRRSTATAATTRTPARRQLRAQPRVQRRRDRRLPGRPRGRGLADRVLTFVVERVRPPARGERLGRHRPRRRRRRLPDRLERQRPDDRRVPGARLDARPDGNVRATSDFRGVYCSLIEDWLNTDAAMVIPGADACRATRSCRRPEALVHGQRRALRSAGRHPARGAASPCAWVGHDAAQCRATRSARPRSGPRLQASGEPQRTPAGRSATARARAAARAAPARCACASARAAPAHGATCRTGSRAPSPSRPRPRARRIRPRGRRPQPPIPPVGVRRSRRPRRRPAAGRRARGWVSGTSRSRASTVCTGQVTIEAQNYGQDPHDMRLQRENGPEVASWPELGPGSPGGVLGQEGHADAGPLHALLHADGGTPPGTPGESHAAAGNDRNADRRRAVSRPSRTSPGCRSARLPTAERGSMSQSPPGQEPEARCKT